ncbi:MAG: glycoside hydrolase family 2 protein, partial [Sphingobacteriales bacterium]
MPLEVRRMETLHDKGLQFIRRKNADGCTYFLNNRTNKPVNDWVLLNTKAVSAAMFDPMFAKSGLAEYRTLNSNGLIEVRVQLQPFESAIVQTFNTKKTGARFPYVESTGKEERIKGDWTIAFVDGGPSIPATLTKVGLGSWTDNEGDAYKAFSGTAKYSINFAKPDGNATAWVLD